MSKIVVLKEIRMNGFRSGEWMNIGYIEIKKSDLWPIIHQYGDVFRRMYSDLTKMYINLQEPECKPHHLDHKALSELRNRLGASAFDKIFGSFPFDDITAFLDEQSYNELVTQYGITGARVITYEIK